MERKDENCCGRVRFDFGVRIPTSSAGGASSRTSYGDFRNRSAIAEVATRPWRRGDFPCCLQPVSVVFDNLLKSDESTPD